MADQVTPTGPRSTGITYQQLLDTDPYPVPAVLRQESPRFLGSDDVPASTVTRRGSGTRARWSGCGGGCGSSPAARSNSRRSATTSSTRSPTCRSSSCVRPIDEIKAYPQRVPAPGPPAEGLRRPLQRVPLPVPRLRVGARRRTGTTCRRGGTSRTSSTRSSACPRPRSARGAGSCSSTPTPTPSRSTDFLGELARAVRALGARGPLHPGPRAAR